MDPFMEEVLSILRDSRGVDLRGYRPQMLRRRVLGRMARVGCENPQAYLKMLRDSSTECARLVDAIAINVSCFFRDPIVFDLLERDVLPEIIARRRDRGERELRIWSAGCAAGQEAYSVAILLHDLLGEDLSAWQLLVFATDIDGEALAQADRGLFDADQLGNVRLAQLRRHFTPVGERYQLNGAIRELIRFSPEDLMRPERIAPSESIFGEMDLVLCRNLLIYLDRPARDEVVGRVARSVAPGGYLVLGRSEALTTEMQRRFRPTDSASRIYRKTTP